MSIEVCSETPYLIVVYTGRDKSYDEPRFITFNARSKDDVRAQIAELLRSVYKPRDIAVYERMSLHIEQGDAKVTGL